MSRSRRLGNLTTLYLRDFQSSSLDSESVIEPLIEAPILRNLSALNSVITSLGDEGAQAISSAEALSRLTQLRLSSCKLGNHGVEMLARSSILADLSTLHLMDFGIGSIGLRAIANSAILSNLTHLGFNGLGLDLDAIEDLIHSPIATGLENLNLGWNFDGRPGIGDQAARIIARSKNLDGLRCLDLSYNGISSEGAKALSESLHLNQLDTLNLSGNPLGLEGILILARSPMGRQPRDLAIRFDCLEDIELENLRSAIAEWEQSTKLEGLFLSGSVIPKTAQSLQEPGSQIRVSNSVVFW